jgi:hypothetical protein
MSLLHRNPPVVMNVKKIRRLMDKYGLSCPIRKANPYRRMGDYIARCEEEEEILYGVYFKRRDQFAIPDNRFVHFDIPLTLGGMQTYP